MSADADWRELIDTAVEQALFKRDVEVSEIESEFEETLDRLQVVAEFRNGGNE